uniref:Uncharacterized protein n=1 Tax=Sphaerodactylus townsendi TaxID=933632 RepID=A0ACB8EFE8_9SAUR
MAVTRNNKKLVLEAKTPDKNGAANLQLEQLLEMTTLTQVETREGFCKVNGRLSKLESEFTEVERDLACLKKFEELIKELKQDLKETNDNMQALETRTGLLRKQVEVLADLLALMDLQMKENTFGFRSWVEEDEVDFEKALRETLANMLDRKEDEIENGIDRCYRERGKEE